MYWIFGAVIVIATTVFVDRVRANSLGATAANSKSSQDWWKYLVAFIVYSIALGLIANGRVEFFLMSKEQSRLLIRSTKPLCLIPKLRRARHVDRDLRHIVDIRVEASGEFSGDIDTRFYKIHFEFEDGTHATALELRCKKRTLERCRIIKDFLFSCATASLAAANHNNSNVSSTNLVGGAAATAPAPSSPTQRNYVAPRKETLPSVPSSSLPRKLTNSGVVVGGIGATGRQGSETIVSLKLDNVG